MKTLSRSPFVWVVVLQFAASVALSATWSVEQKANSRGPGKEIVVSTDGKPVAGLIHGEGQFKPYLHVYGEQGELLTNSGLDAGGKPAGKFPHHRGIFIGWNQISSDLPPPNDKVKTYDLWHFNNGGKMELVRFDSSTTKDGATLIATISWRGGKEDASGSDQLLTETRTLKISRPAGKRTQIDARFELKAARDLGLGGDMQHAGIHFRASDEVATRAAETAYVSDPDNKESKGKDWKPGPAKKDKDGKEVKAAEPAHADLKWCRLVFPIGQKWYSATELNASSNPAEELSWRDYGRFGFFFKRSLKKGETLDVAYRFIVAPAEAPAEKAKLSAAQAAKARDEAAADFAVLAKSGGR